MKCTGLKRLLNTIIDRNELHQASTHHADTAQVQIQSSSHVEDGISQVAI